jgi:archaellum biogenesis protein FlaJ (TadC family)
MVMLSLVLFFVSFLLIGFVIWRLPEDYFINEKHSCWIDPVRYPNFYWLWRMLRNIIGVLLIIAGVMMLVLPGQGFLTIVTGLMLVDFPIKKRFLDRLSAIRSVQKSLNYLRKKLGKPPFLYP